MKRVPGLVVTLIALTLGLALPAVGQAAVVARDVHGPAQIAGATFAEFDGVSCPASRVCVAVGFEVTDSGVSLPLAESSTSAGWTVMNVPDPSDTIAATLQSVSCSAPTQCTAVGFATSPAGQDLGLVETWDGTAWTIQTAPDPAGADQSELTGVSCPTAQQCVAVGVSTNDAGAASAYAEMWNGSTWALQDLPVASPIYSLLLGVSCPSAASCVAVGSEEGTGFSTAGLIERWTASGGWTLPSVPAPTGSIDARFVSVSCSSASACTTVGYDDLAAMDESPVAERWNGTAWSLQNPRAHLLSILDPIAGVSCPTAIGCVTVGSWVASTEIQLTLAEASYGKLWTIQPTPNAAGGSYQQFTGVSCPAAGLCTAVGYDIDPLGTAVPLVALQSGRSWSLQSTP